MPISRCFCPLTVDVETGYSSQPTATSSSHTGGSGYATQARSGQAPSSYGTGSSYVPGSYAGNNDSYASEQHSTLQTMASYVPGTQANADSKAAAGGGYGSSSGYDNTSSTYDSSHHTATGSGEGYVGGTLGETIASYIPGTQANAASKDVTSDHYGSGGDYTSSSSGYGAAHQAPKGSGEGYIGGTTGEAIASYIPGTQANVASKEIAADHYGSSGDYTSSSSGYGSAHQAPKGSGEGYIGGATGETVASYIPGTQANAESKAIANDSYGSEDAYNGGTHNAPASSGILGSIAAVIPGTEAYRETHDTTSSSQATRDPISRGYSSTAPASNEYTSTSGRGQGYADKYPGGDTYAAGGGIGATIASYIPGVCWLLARVVLSLNPAANSSRRNPSTRLPDRRLSLRFWFRCRVNSPW